MQDGYPHTMPHTALRLWPFVSGLFGVWVGAFVLCGNAPYSCTKVVHQYMYRIRNGMVLVGFSFRPFVLCVQCARASFGINQFTIGLRQRSWRHGGLVRPFARSLGRPLQTTRTRPRFARTTESSRVQSNVDMYVSCMNLEVLYYSCILSVWYLYQELVCWW